MINIPLPYQFSGPALKPLKVSNGNGGGRYDRKNVVTPPYITNRLNEIIKCADEEEEEQKAECEKKIVVDPYANIKPTRDFQKEPLPELTLEPIVSSNLPVFGSLISLSPVKRTVVFDDFTPPSPSSSVVDTRTARNLLHHRSGWHASREMATKLGLTLSRNLHCNSDHGNIIVGNNGVHSMLPSVALAPLRGFELAMTDDEFTHSNPSYHHYPSLDCFGIGNFNENLRPTFERTRLHTPSDIQRKVHQIKSDLETKVKLAAEKEFEDIRRSTMNDIGGALSVSSRSTKTMASSKSVRMTETSRRQNSFRHANGGNISRFSDCSRPNSFIESPSSKTSPLPSMNENGEHSTPKSEANVTKKKEKQVSLSPLSRTSSMEIPEPGLLLDAYSFKSATGKTPGSTDTPESKFYFSENEAHHKMLKMEHRNALLEKRKADTLAKTQQLLHQKQALTAATKSKKVGGSMAEAAIESSYETRQALDLYVGNKAKRAFSKLFYAATNELAKYPHFEDLPDSKRNDPRYLFVREQALRKQAPLQLLIREDDTMSGICLGGKGLGDDRMLPVIHVLDLLPAVYVIDLNDNRLTDISLMPLAQKLLGLKSLTHLDLSFNKIDDSSATIMAYLRCKGCKLQTLYLNGADVDDSECGNLMDAISDNTTVTKLGLSNNLIGKAEPYNTVYPDLITGGEAIGAMLLANSTLKSLDLAWNAIRLASAEELGAALNVNCTLMVLNLEHNSFGDLGTQILGFSLKKNHTLLELNIAYNSLVPKSASVLANALSYNDTLTMLNMDGNIIGNVGMQSLVSAIQRSAGEQRVLKISFENCDCKKEDPDLFNPADPDGIWEVDLSTPYGRMVAEECIFLSNYRAGCNLNKLTYNGRIIKLQRKLEAEDVGKYPVEEFNELCIRAAADLLADKIQESAKTLSNILSRQFKFSMPVSVGMKVLSNVKEHWDEKMLLNSNNPIQEELHDVFLFEVFFSLFVINDANYSKTMELDEFVETLAGLGKPNYDREILHRLMADYDLDDSGTIDANEFSMIMVNHFCNTDRPRGLLVDASTDAPWYIPDTGTAVFQMHYESELPKCSDIGRDEGIDSVIFAMQDAKTDVQRDALFEQPVNSPYFFLNADQAQLLYDEVMTYSKNKLEPLALILPQIVSSEQCLVFLDSNLDEYGKLELRVRLGPLYNAYVGVPTGHYCLDIEKVAHMKGGLRLAATSVSEANYCRVVGTNTSQTGKYSSFRNEICNDRPVTVAGSWFSNCPKTGSLRFDFVSTTRPRLGTKPLSDPRFDRLMQKLQLFEITHEQTRIEKFLKASAKSKAKQEAESQRQSYALSPNRTSGLAIGKESSANSPDSQLRLSRLTSGATATNGSEDKKKKQQTYEPTLRAPLTIIHVKEHFTEYMDSCHHYVDICPPERRLEGSSANSQYFERPVTPENFSNGVKPSVTAMPPIFPLAYMKLLEIQIIIPSIHISVAQFSRMMEYFPSDGYLRVQLLQTVFARLTDLENLWPVLDSIFTEDETREALFRLGLLNVYDPLFPDRDYKLDLRRWEEREMAKMLIVFANAEPGENWIGETFRWTKYDPAIPGWCLPQSWTLEDGPNTGPHDHGWLTLKYTSYGEGCHANILARKSQRKRCLVGMKRPL